MIGNALAMEMDEMGSYDSPLHIISTRISELGITFASKSVAGKSGEIPAVQQLIAELDLEGCMIVADALNCQKETAEAVVKGKGDYLLAAKGDQAALELEIRDYVQDESLRKTMDCKSVTEKSRDRLETGAAYATADIDWLYGKEKRKNLCCIGAIRTEFERKGAKAEEWHYSSRNLTAPELLHHARMEWAVESLHWLLDVHFSEDYCRIVNRTIQQNLNMLRKFALRLIKHFKASSHSKRPLLFLLFLKIDFRGLGVMAGGQSLFGKTCRLQAANPYIIIYSLLELSVLKQKEYRKRKWWDCKHGEHGTYTYIVIVKEVTKRHMGKVHGNVKRNDEMVMKYLKLPANGIVKKRLPPYEAQIIREQKKRLENCNRFGSMETYEASHVRVLLRTFLCKDKFCSNCNQVKKMLLQNRFLPYMEQYKYSLYHMVLTVPD